jgi:WD40 repeat protein
MCDQDRLAQLVHDARRFIMYHKVAIEGYPLQTYASALLFSPIGSLIRQLFQHEEPETISIRPALSDGWSACLQTLEGHGNPASSVAFSHDSTRLALASHDSTVKVWDINSGACVHTLKGHIRYVRSVAFSHNSTLLALASDDSTIKMWDARSGVCLQTPKVGRTLYDLSFDHNGSRLSTEIGTFDIQSLEASSMIDFAEPARPTYLGTGFSSDGIWVQHAGNNMLWVPSEYRPSRLSMCGTMVGVGVGSGRVWICSIDL